MGSGESGKCDKCGDESKCDETSMKPKCVREGLLAQPSDVNHAKCEVS